MKDEYKEESKRRGRKTRREQTLMYGVSATQCTSRRTSLRERKERVGKVKLGERKEGEVKEDIHTCCVHAAQ